MMSETVKVRDVPAVEEKRAGVWRREKSVDSICWIRRYMGQNALIGDN